MRYLCTLVICLIGVIRMAWGEEGCDCKPVLPDEQYVLGADSEPHPGVPEGTVIEFWLKRSKIYPGFEHRVWLYVPAQYDGKTAIPLMMFLDGTSFVARDGAFRVPVVLNNLIAKQELPVMAAVFIDPGEAAGRLQYEKASDGSPLLWETHLASRFNHRSMEYEPMSARYADFLVSEVLPQVRRSVKITEDPNGRGVGGLSSGAIGAFSAAWHRPEQFRKVFAAIGSFPTMYRGAPGYPQLVRETDRQPLRLFFQSGARDKSKPEFGVGEERHRDLIAALKAQGYDYQFVFGEGTHSTAHAAAIFPQAMRWLWRDYPR